MKKLHEAPLKISVKIFFANSLKSFQAIHGFIFKRIFGEIHGWMPEKKSYEIPERFSQETPGSFYEGYCGGIRKLQLNPWENFWCKPFRNFQNYLWRNFWTNSEFPKELTGGFFKTSRRRLPKESVAKLLKESVF